MSKEAEQWLTEQQAAAGIVFLYRAIKRVTNIDAMLVIGGLIVELLKIVPDWKPEEK